MEADVYSNSPYAEGEYKFCQINPEMMSSVTIKVVEKHKKRENSKKWDSETERLKKINLFGKNFEKKVTERKKRMGNNVLGLEDL